VQLQKLRIHVARRVKHDRTLASLSVKKDCVLAVGTGLAKRAVD